MVGDGVLELRLEIEVRQDLEQLAARYIKEEAARTPALSMFLQQGRVALHVKPVKVTEFSVGSRH